MNFKTDLHDYIKIDNVISKHLCIDTINELTKRPEDFKQH